MRSILCLAVYADTALLGQTQMAAFDGRALATDIHMMLAHRASAKNQVKCGRKRQCRSRPRRQARFWGGRRGYGTSFEDGPIIGFFHFTFVTRQQAGRAQKSGVVSRAWQTKVDMQQTGEAMHEHAQAGLGQNAPRQTPPIWPTLQTSGSRGFQATLTRQFGITLLNGANFLMLALGGNLTSQGLPAASGRVLICPLAMSYCTSALGRAPCGEPRSRPVRAGLRPPHPPGRALSWASASRPLIRRLGIGVLGRDKTQAPMARWPMNASRSSGPGWRSPLLTKDTIHRQ